MNNKVLWIGGIMLGLLLFTAVFGPFLPFIDHELRKENFRLGENNEINIPPFPPSEGNLLGTDIHGRDLLSVLVVGARETLLIVISITILRYLIAIPLAITASKQSGPMYWLMNGWNQLFSGLPTLFAAILLVNMPFVLAAQHRTLWVIVILAVLEVGRVSYIFQQQAYGLSKSTFVEAGRSIGNSQLGIYRRYYFPHLLPQIIVNFVTDLGRVMLLIGQLGFFSIFVSQIWIHADIGLVMLQNTTNDWATLLADSRRYIRTDIWVPFYPAFAIAFSVVTFNLFGEGLRQYFENKSKSRYSEKLEKQYVEEMKQEKEIDATNRRVVDF